MTDQKNEGDAPSPDEVRRDVDVILWSMRLQQIKRFTHQRFWEAETRDALYAAKAEPYPPLESVADHSWHVADCILLLAEYCEQVDIGRCLELAIVHDKMEITINDWSPLGRDGTGKKSHAFNAGQRLRKDAAERAAIESYTARLRPALRKQQRELLVEALECTTPEAKFVKAVDKLQALAFVLCKKRGLMHDRHIVFSLRYSGQVCALCPPLSWHYFELRRRLIRSVAKKRKVPIPTIEAIATPGDTLPLFADETGWQ